MFDPIGKAMGYVLHFIYNNLAFGSYGLAIIIFTVVIKVIILPLTVKQYKSTAKMQEIQPQLQEIQKRYKNDKEKLQQETMRIYQESKANPAGGCLPLLIQMPILFSLYWVISQPLKFVFGKSAEVTQQLLQKVPEASRIAGNNEISIINYFNSHKEELANVQGLLNSNELLNMNFFGLNLGVKPSLNYNPALGWQYFGLLLIPILAALTTFLSVKYSAAKAPQTSDNAMANSMTNSMTTIMPFMTGFFALNVPAGLGLYWIISNIFQVAQQMYLNKYVLKKKEVTVK